MENTSADAGHTGDERNRHVMADKFVEQPTSLEGVNDTTQGGNETVLRGCHTEFRLAEGGEGHIEYVDQPATCELADQCDDLFVRKDRNKCHHVVQFQLVL